MFWPSFRKLSFDKVIVSFQAIINAGKQGPFFKIILLFYINTEICLTRYVVSLFQFHQGIAEPPFSDSFSCRAQPLSATLKICIIKSTQMEVLVLLCQSWKPEENVLRMHILFINNTYVAWKCTIFNENSYKRSTEKPGEEKWFLQTVNIVINLPSFSTEPIEESFPTIFRRTSVIKHIVRHNTRENQMTNLYSRCFALKDPVLVYIWTWALLPVDFRYAPQLQWVLHTKQE